MKGEQGGDHSPARFHTTQWPCGNARAAIGVQRMQWPGHAGQDVRLSFVSSYGVIAITRRGLPEPPTILSGAAMTRAPVGGS
jgi:hypothetical protein